MQLNNFSKQNFWIDTDKLSSGHSYTSSGLRTTQGAVTYIVAKGHAAHSFMEWIFKIGGTKEDPIPYVIKMELTYFAVKSEIIDPDVN